MSGTAGEADELCQKLAKVSRMKLSSGRIQVPTRERKARAEKDDDSCNDHSSGWIDIAGITNEPKQCAGFHRSLSDLDRWHCYMENVGLKALTDVGYCLGAQDQPLHWDRGRPARPRRPDAIIGS